MTGWVTEWVIQKIKAYSAAPPQNQKPEASISDCQRFPHNRLHRCQRDDFPVQLRGQSHACQIPDALDVLFVPAAYFGQRGGLRLGKSPGGSNRLIHISGYYSAGCIFHCDGVHQRLHIAADYAESLVDLGHFSRLDIVNWHKVKEIGI